MSPGNNGAWPWTSGARRGLEPADFRHGLREDKENPLLHLFGCKSGFSGAKVDFLVYFDHIAPSSPVIIWLAGSIADNSMN